MGESFVPLKLAVASCPPFVPFVLFVAIVTNRVSLLPFDRPDANFFEVFDRARMKGRARISNDVFGIDGFAGRVLFDDFCAAFVQGFGEVVNRVFAQAVARDEVHGADVHARIRLGLPAVRVGRDGGGKEEGIGFEEARFGSLVVGNERDVLRRAGLGDGRGGHGTA